jgi:2-polyprenyl-6-methoxyphenol hydroxylase-like FAD-dependent oxidoreductase
MDPTLASGAGSAIEDAYILTYLLARAVDSPSTEMTTNVTSALLIYDQVRRPLATEVQRQSRALLRIYALADNPEDKSAEALKSRIKEVWKWSASYCLSSKLDSD